MTDKTTLGTAHKAAIAKARTGTKHTEETKQKIRESWIRRKAKTAKTKIAEGGNL